MKKIKYSDQVFINCPFDEEYAKLFRALVFTILDSGFVPRCSLEFDASINSRLESIVTIINNCRYGIHDLSRVKVDENTKLPRFNMPFEYGLFYGARAFGEKEQRLKNCLVLDKAKYRYKKFISDISGIDVKAHENSAKNLIILVRNWLATASKRSTIPEGEKIILRYMEFQKEIRQVCKKRDISYGEMPFGDLIQNMTDWLALYEYTREPLFGCSPT